MKKISLIIWFFAGLLFAGCEEVVDVDLNTAKPKLVVEASINWYKGTAGNEQKIKLTKTSGYFQQPIPVVSGATVFITNSANTVFNFLETPGTGEYICNTFIPELNENYVLTVISEGQTYTATESLKPVPEISETIEQHSDGGFGGDEIDVKFFFQDNGAELNSYMARYDTPIHPFPSYDVFDDEFFQGNQMFGIYFDEDIKQGDALKFTLYGISKRYQNYMTILLNAANGDGGGPFQTIPSNARGNIVNTTNSGDFPLGYFRLSEVDSVDYTIQ